ncbi:MAG: IS30 family transposase [Oscillospiraceae bacterium]|jgi:IS30 family transposase|nr:IS30 family transposase [Oscillospiraceae bacterium]
MRGYKHLTFHDRLKIEKLKKQGVRQNRIAAAIHVSESTVSRELRRGVYTHLNSDYTTEQRYSPDIAQERYDINKTAKGSPLKIGKDHALAKHIERKIAGEKYSPGAVLAELAASDTPVFSVTLCRQTLYSYISAGVFLALTNKDLPFGGKRGRQTPRRVRPVRASKGESIEKRPEIIQSREEFGHWEMDTVVGGKRGGKGCLLVLTERATRREIAVKLPNHTAAATVRALDRLEYKYGELFPCVFKSITMDNGSEFADCEGMERSIYGGKRTKCYYCHPYSSFERGSNEKQNQMLRRHFPKGTDFDRVSEEEVSRVEDWLNNYPRKILGWASSEKLFSAAISSLASL